MVVISSEALVLDLQGQRACLSSVGHCHSGLLMSLGVHLVVAWMQSLQVGASHS